MTRRLAAWLDETSRLTIAEQYEAERKRRELEEYEYTNDVATLETDVIGEAEVAAVFGE